MPDLSGAARDAAGEVHEKAEQLYDRTSAAARDAAGQVREKGEQLYNKAADQAERQATHLADLIKEQPIVSALVAVAVGYLLGRLTSGIR